MFVSERGAPFTVSGLQKMVEHAGIEAKMPFKVHPHMLRHATGYALANKGTDTRTLQAYLGHRSIQRRSDIANYRLAGSRTCGGDTLNTKPHAVGSRVSLNFEQAQRPGH